VERVKQTFFNKLKKLSDFGRTEWITSVEEATTATNISYNRSIGTSLFIFRFGRMYEDEIDIEFGARGRA
jgi:hypothetical protein